MLGLVARLELARGGRGGRPVRVRWAYLAWLAGLLAVGGLLCLHEQQGRVGAAVERLRLLGAWATFGLRALTAQHLLFLALVVPAWTAGSITDEKARGTLTNLLTTPLGGGAL